MSWFDRLFRRQRLRRKALVDRPFPADRLRILQRAAPFYRCLHADHQRALRDAVQIFIAEKEFLGIGDLEITDEIKVAVAGQACLLIVGLPDLDVYPRQREVIVYPRGFGEVVEAVAPDGRRFKIPQTRAGEAWRRGPVVLAWDSVRHAIARPCDGYNVVFHEFAHVLDMQAGIADGAPPLGSKTQHMAWSRVFNAEFDAFVEASRRGRNTFLDPYGASEPAEFFAVVTEHFFEQPREFEARHPELYEQLRIFYGQDPGKWKYDNAGISTRGAPWMRRRPG